MSDDMRDRIADAVVSADLAYSRGEVGGPLGYAMADAVLAVLRDPSDEDVERVAEEREPGLFSLSMNNYSIRFDNHSEEIRKIHQEEACEEARAALRAYLGGGEA